jgi:hypothetical protein
VEGVVGFGIVRVPTVNGALCATVSNPSIKLDRLTRENEKWTTGPVSLLECTPINIMFGKSLTRKSRNYIPESLLLHFLHYLTHFKE